MRTHAPGGFSIRRGVAALLIASTALYGTAAQSQETSRGSVAALDFDRSSGTLLEATSKGLYRSADEGRTWNVLPLPPAIRGHVAAVAASAKGKDVLYVAGPGIGVLRSADGGRSWAKRNKGLPGNDVLVVATHADQPNTVYAYVAARGIFRSENGGARWRLMDAGPRDRIVRLIHSNMRGSMQTGWFFAATQKGVRRSMDCFCGWHDAGGLERPIRAVAYDPREPQQVYAATDDGLSISANGGEQWARVNAPAPEVTALVVTPTGVLYAATASGALFRSSDRAKSWAPVDA